MPAVALLLHFPDNQETELAANGELPQVGDEILAGWIVTECRVAKRPKRAEVDVWVTAKSRRKTTRQRTDRP